LPAPEGPSIATISRFDTTKRQLYHHAPALTPMRRSKAAGAVLLTILVALVFATRFYLRGAAFVVQAAGMDGAARTATRWYATEVAIADAAPVPWRGGSLRARAYRPARLGGRPILLVPGVHASGIDEPRLVGFARDIAATGHPVLTVELPDLKRYEITVRTTDMIEDAAAWMVRTDGQHGDDGRIGMLGISFGGGLSIVAAGRPAIRDRVAFVMAFGGHADLPRTLRFLCTGVQPDGTQRAPHDYGLAIVLLDAAEHVVPAPQVAPLRAAILSYLEASRLDMVDKPAAAREFEHAKALATSLDEPARTYMGFVNARDVVHLGPVLLPFMDALGGDPALSPARAPAPAAPVYLLHGTDDNVVPAIESTLLAHDLKKQDRAVHVLLTPLITHAEVDRSSTAAAVWQLVDFWARLLDE
jgi:dienelactone hydrolase